MDQILLPLTAGAGLALATLTILYLAIAHCCRDTSHRRTQASWEAIQNSSGDDCKTSVAVAESHEQLAQLQQGELSASTNSWTILSPERMDRRKQAGDSRFKAWLRASEQCIALVPGHLDGFERNSSGSRINPRGLSEQSFRAAHVREPHCDLPVDCLVDDADENAETPVRSVDRAESESCVAIDIQEAWSPRESPQNVNGCNARKPMDSAQSMAKGGQEIPLGCESMSSLACFKSEKGECQQYLLPCYDIETCSEGELGSLNNHLVGVCKNEAAEVLLTPVRQPIGAIPEFPAMLEHKPTLSVTTLAERMAFLS